VSTACDMNRQKGTNTMIRPIPDHLLENGKSTSKFFEKENGVFKLKSEEQYALVC